MRYRYSTPAPPKQPDCLFLGPVRAVNDRQAKEIVIQTAEDHPQGFRMPVCRLPSSHLAEARAIVALSDLIAAARPFTALGRALAEHDPQDPIISNAAAELDITAGDVHALAAALDRALGPADSFRAAGRGIAPRPVNKP